MHKVDDSMMTPWWRSSSCQCMVKLSRPTSCLVLQMKRWWYSSLTFDSYWKYDQKMTQSWSDYATLYKAYGMQIRSYNKMARRSNWMVIGQIFKTPCLSCSVSQATLWQPLSPAHYLQKPIKRRKMCKKTWAIACPQTKGSFGQRIIDFRYINI